MVWACVRCADCATSNGKCMELIIVCLSTNFFQKVDIHIRLWPWAHTHNVSWWEITIEDENQLWNINSQQFQMILQWNNWYSYYNLKKFLFVYRSWSYNFLRLEYICNDNVKSETQTNGQLRFLWLKISSECLLYEIQWA